MNRGTTISLYLVDGDPSGIICAYLSNWTGQAIKIPRNVLDKAKLRYETNRIGIYFLFGYSDENPEERIVYIGESDNIYERLIKHAKDENKSFWTEAVAFTSKDDNLTKGHIRYLEYELIRLSKMNSKYTVSNKNETGRPSLPEMAVSDMDTFLDKVKIVLPTLGYDLLEKIMKEKKTKIYYMEQSGVKARGFTTNNGFTVTKGSEVSREIKESLSNAYKNQRESLIQKEIIKLINNKLIFDKDYEFSSSSAAAAIIVGYSVNGRNCWKDDKGRTLKQNEEDILG
jgi:hypothetical protein